MLKWVMGRLSGEANAVSTPVGNIPGPNDIDTSGLDIGEAAMAELLKVDKQGWLSEIESIKENYKTYGDKLPKELERQLTALEDRLAEF